MNDRIKEFIEKESTATRLQSADNLADNVLVLGTIDGIKFMPATAADGIKYYLPMPKPYIPIAPHSNNNIFTIKGLGRAGLVAYDEWDIWPVNQQIELEIMDRIVQYFVRINSTCIMALTSELEPVARLRSVNAAFSCEWRITK